MIYFLFLFLLLLVYVFCVPLRIAVNHLLYVIFYGFKDSYLWFLHHGWNNAPFGSIDCYTGLFGRGKTLSAVHFVTNYYNRYNNKLVWNGSKFVPQYIHIISNVKLSVPYTDFVCMDQLLDVADNVQQYNIDNDCKVVTIAFIDEASTQLNSRNFKNNFSAPLLNSILCMRHFSMSLILTSQRFGHMDALLRQVTTNVIECRKIWRLQVQSRYDAWELENCSNPDLIKPKTRGGFFVKDCDYQNYDTMAVVKNMIKDYRAGKLLSDQEILALQGTTGNPDLINEKSFRRRLRRRSKEVRH